MKVIRKDLAAEMIKRAEEVKGRKEGNYEKLSCLLRAGAEDFLSYKSPVSYNINKSNRTVYRKIIAKIEALNSTIEDFVWFAFQQDWHRLNEKVPNSFILGADTFLESFQWYVGNKDALQEAETVLEVYDKSFGIQGPRSLNEKTAALKLQNELKNEGISLVTFFNYAASIQWRTFSIAPPLLFLAADGFLKQFYTYMHKNGTRKAVKRKYYLTNILECIAQRSGATFEDYNWNVAEAIFEPLQEIVSNGSVYNQLAALVYTAVNEKQLSTFGRYVITEDSKFTPLAVYWLVFVSDKLQNFCPPDQDWKEIMKQYAHKDVNLQALERLW